MTIQKALLQIIISTKNNFLLYFSAIIGLFFVKNSGYIRIYLTNKIYAKQLYKPFTKFFCKGHFKNYFCSLAIFLMPENIDYKYLLLINIIFIVLCTIFFLVIYTNFMLKGLQHWFTYVIISALSSKVWLNLISIFRYLLPITFIFYTLGYNSEIFMKILSHFLNDLNYGVNYHYNHSLKFDIYGRKSIFGFDGIYFSMSNENVDIQNISHHSINQRDILLSRLPENVKVDFYALESHSGFTELEKKQWLSNTLDLDANKKHLILCNCWFRIKLLGNDPQWPAQESRDILAVIEQICFLRGIPL